jgi:hypothetical protein
MFAKYPDKYLELYMTRVITSMFAFQLVGMELLSIEINRKSTDYF